MRLIIVLFLLSTINGYSQCKDFIIGVKGDTLNCVDRSGLKQGPWVIKVESLRGEPGFEEEGFFKNGNKEGIWRRYSLQGDLIAMENFRWGFRHGQNVYFNNMGNVVREEYWRAVDPQNPYDTVPVYDVDDPSKVVGTTVVKLEGQSLKHGTWTFYDPYTGTITKTEKWFLDKPANKDGTAAAGDEDLLPLDVSNGKSDTTGKKTAAKPKEVLEFEKKNSGKKKIKVRDGRTGG